MKQDTICALATPPGGAIAIVRVSGPDAVAITGSIFSKSLEKAEGYTRNSTMSSSPSFVHPIPTRARTAQR